MLEFLEILLSLGAFARFPRETFVSCTAMSFFHVLIYLALHDMMYSDPYCSLSVSCKNFIAPVSPQYLGMVDESF